MSKILKKEMKLSASILAYVFIVFGLMFFLPGYPILCGAFFMCLGLYQSFQYAREANDIVFSALLPISKKDVVKGKFEFVCFIQLCGMMVMLFVTLLRMTVFANSAVYRANVMMNANPFALGMALVIFGLFNLIFVRGFFRTAYNFGKPFVLFIIVNFLVIGVAEATHHFPAMANVNAFGFDHIGLQMGLLAGGIVIYVLLSVVAYRCSCNDFEKIDL